MRLMRLLFILCCSFWTVTRAFLLSSDDRPDAPSRRWLLSEDAAVEDDRLFVDTSDSNLINDNNNSLNRTGSSIHRRQWVKQACSVAVALATMDTTAQKEAVAAIDVSSLSTSPSAPLRQSSPTSTASTTTTTFLDPEQAKITDKVFMDVRISRQDGTFYVRDDLPDTPENRVFLGRLTIGLFGQAAPNHVARFKSYIHPAADDPLDDNPLPSYSRSTFASLDQATGVLTGGRIPALEATVVNGSPALRYGGRLLPASLWLEDSSVVAVTRLSHSNRGLLTHGQLDLLPTFGVTTRRDTRELDATSVVFGRILWDDDATAFFDIIRDLPTYSMDRTVVSGTSTANDGSAAEPSLVEESARAVYAAQKQFFRSAAKAVGDTRLDKVYEGKLLRRVEVTRVGLL